MTALCFERFQFLISERYVLALFNFEPADQFAAIDDRVVHRAIDLLLDAAVVLGVQQIKAHTAGTRGRKQPDRN